MSTKDNIKKLRRLMAKGVAAVHRYKQDADAPIALIAGIAEECGYAFDFCPCGGGILIHTEDATLFDAAEGVFEANVEPNADGTLPFGVSEVAEA